MVLLRLSGSFLLRLAERQFLPLLFQEPPRTTRLSPTTITQCYCRRRMGAIANPIAASFGLLQVR